MMMVVSVNVAVIISCGTLTIMSVSSMAAIAVVWWSTYEEAVPLWSLVS